MGSVCSTLGAVCIGIKNWLVAGLNLAVNAIKWIWKQACSLFEAAREFVRGVFQRFGACFSYHRQRNWAEVNGNRVEVGRDEFFVGAEVNQNRDGESVQSVHNPNQPSPSVQREAVMKGLREGLSDQDKKDITFCKELFGVLDDCVKEDPQHESMEGTEDKLMDLMNSDAARRFMNLSGLGMISSSLA